MKPDSAVSGGKVVYVNGPIVRVDGGDRLHMYELVQVGE